ncbi:MAG: hypothetical protein JW947_03640 [Sedimentisphaerales bacterium]|nr:hypothetical protein [Sedimentisphaerales bacterium]
MNISDYITSGYSNNSQFGPTQKQSQTKPKFTCRKGCKAKTNPTFSEPVEPSNPILKGVQVKDKYDLKIHLFKINYPIVVRNLLD